VQPLNGERLTSFPIELQGTWGAEKGDSISIQQSAIVSKSSHFDSLGALTAIHTERTQLTDSLLLYKSGKYYVFNELSKAGYYTITIVEKDRKGNLNHYFCDDPFQFKNIHELTVDSASVFVSEYDSSNDEIIEYDSVLVEPSIKELKNNSLFQINGIYFSGQITPQKLKRLCKKRFLYMRYMTDGNVYIPEE
jgi:hypothetical protein